jgi:hypothetical protein
VSADLSLRRVLRSLGEGGSPRRRRRPWRRRRPSLPCEVLPPHRSGMEPRINQKSQANTERPTLQPKINLRPFRKGRASRKGTPRYAKEEQSHNEKAEEERGKERTRRTEFTTEAQSSGAATKSSSCSWSCSCSKRGGINWTGFVCPLRSACFVGRRSCGDALRARSPRSSIGRARTSASSVEPLPAS